MADTGPQFRMPAGTVLLAQNIGITHSTITMEQRVTLVNDIIESYKSRETDTLLVYLYRRRCLGANHMQDDFAAETIRKTNKVLRLILHPDKWAGENYEKANEACGIFNTASAIVLNDAVQLGDVVFTPEDDIPTYPPRAPSDNPWGYDESPWTVPSSTESSDDNAGGSPRLSYSSSTSA